MADDSVEAVYAWAIDGVPRIFVETEELNTAWAVAGGFATSYAGLIAPQSLPCAIDLRLGELDDTDAQIQVEDIDGTLAALFGSRYADADALTTTLEPGATAGASLFSKHVGLEAIGSAGERRRHSCIPGYNIGLRHLGHMHANEIGQGPTPVTDTPVLWPGRRCAIYRVKKIGGTWQALSAAKRLWFGTLLGQGEHDAGTWTFKCAGPESWASGNLGIGAWENPLTLIPVTAIDDNTESLVTVGLRLIQLDSVELGEPFHVWQEIYEDNLSGVTDYEDLVNQINAILDDAQDDAGSGDVYREGASQIRYSISAGHDGFCVQWERDSEDASGFDPATDSEQYVVELRIQLHEKAWFMLGYDVRQQTDALDPVEQADAFGLFRPMDPQVGPGRYTGYFYSANARAMAAFVSADQDFSALDKYDFTNGQAERRWPPLNSGGAVAWSGEVGQEFQIDAPTDPVHMTGSLNRPVMSAGDDLATAYSLTGGLVCNRQGLLVVSGPYRRRGDNDKVDPIAGYAFEVERERREGQTVQVLMCAWREGDAGSIATDSAGLPRLVVMAWMDPRMYGFDYSRFTGTWGGLRDPQKDARGMVGRPLTVFEYNTSLGDRLDLVLQRVLATTGTAGTWYSDSGKTVPVFGNPGVYYFEEGSNDLGTGFPTDAEYAELGLGVPASMIQDDAAWLDSLLEIGPNLRRCKAAFASVVSARHLVRTLLSPTGLCMSLAGGKFGIFDPWRLPSPSNADAVIDKEWYAGEPGDPTSAIPSQNFRIFAPIDLLEVKARIEPVEGKHLRTFERKATDFASRYRQQTIRHAITGDHLVHPSVPGEEVGSDWQPDFNERWRRGFDFWGTQHFAVNLDLHAEDAIDLWPGNSILLADEWLADPGGEYGISNAPGWIVSRTFDCVTERVMLRVIVNAETDFYMYCPAANCTRYDENDLGSGHRLKVDDDWLGARAGESFDCSLYDEPSWSTEGGNALIEVYQFDGASWTGGIYGTVTSVTESVGACWLNLSGAMTGAAFRSDRHSIVVLRKWDEQTAAWVLRWFAPVCLEDGTHSTGEDGVKLRA
jgi:hypothetical protein